MSLCFRYSGISKSLGSLQCHEKMQTIQTGNYKYGKVLKKNRIWGGRGGFRENLFLCIVINVESGFIKRTKEEHSKGPYAPRMLQDSVWSGQISLCIRETAKVCHLSSDLNPLGFSKNIFEPLNASYGSLSFLFTYPLHHHHSWGKVQPSVQAKCFPHCPNNMASQAHTSLVPSFPSFLSLLIISEGISDFFLIMKSQKWTSLKSWRVIKSPHLC